MAKKLAKKQTGGDTLKKKQPGAWGKYAEKVAELNATKEKEDKGPRGAGMISSNALKKSGDTAKIGTVTLTKRKSGGVIKSKKK